MSHAMAHQTGTGAHRLWSISCGLASGLERRGEYNRTMDLADMPRQGDLDGRRNLSLKALQELCCGSLVASIKFSSSRDRST
jgi:hypothetical protein